MASAPFSTAALAQSQSPAGASNSGRRRTSPGELGAAAGGTGVVRSILRRGIYHKTAKGQSHLWCWSSHWVHLDTVLAGTRQTPIAEPPLLRAKPEERAGERRFF